jgi:hypothetical protein
MKLSILKKRIIYKNTTLFIIFKVYKVVSNAVYNKIH